MRSYNQSYKELFVRGNQSEERWLKVHHKIGNIVNNDSCKASLVEYRIKPVKMSVESKLNVCGSCHRDVFPQLHDAAFRGSAGNFPDLR